MPGFSSVTGWLLDSDPSIRWQVMRDLLDTQESEWRAERSKVETEGWGAKLLSHEDADGQWAGGAFLPSDFDAREWEEVGQPWTATTFSLSQLREFGLDPSSARAQRAVALIGANSRWDEGGQPYWEGEVEEWRGISVGAQAISPSQYWRSSRRKVSPVVASKPMALRHPASAQLLLVGRRSHQCRARPKARRSNRPRSSQTPGGRRLAPRLESERPRLVRSGRTT